VRLRVVGAGLPRTGTSSLKDALELLLGGRVYHMHEVFRAPEDLPVWRAAIRGDEVDWSVFPPDCVATLDWPASVFWRELAAANPDAPIVLSTRESAAVWWESCDQTVFNYMRRTSYPDYEEWLEMIHELLAREMGADWDDRAVTEAYYERHNAAVRAEAPADRLLEFPAGSGWEPLCAALGVPVPDEPFPHVNTRAEFNS
jgi:hypothetical protein